MTGRDYSRLIGHEPYNQEIPEGSFIHTTAVVYSNVTIGKNVYIGPFCVIGGAAESSSGDTINKPKGKVYIGDGCTLYKHVTIDSGSSENSHTIVGQNNVFMAGSHVGHDAHIDDNCVFCCGARVGGHSVVRDNCTMGLNSSLHQKSDMCEGSMIGANSFGKGVLKAFTIYAGVPGKDIGENWRLRDKLRDQQK